MTVQYQNAPQPTQGEQYRQFVERAHYALLSSVPDPDLRNKLVWDAWDQAHGNEIGSRVAQAFPADQYRNVPAICYFIEHETTGRDGKAVKYTVKELADIVDEHNDRADTDNWTAITDGHTHDGIVPQHMQPKVIGYAGPYRLGMVGHAKPKFAVFADEHHVLSEKPLLDRKRRRSVEINRFRDGRRPYIDPVAALGAESPRLPLPVARYQDGEADKCWYVIGPGSGVERYEFAQAGGMNTFIPSDNIGAKRHRYESPESATQSQGNQSMNVNPNQGDDLIPRLVQALMETPQMQWVTQQMEQAGPQNQQPVGAGQPPVPNVNPDESQDKGGMPPMANQNRYSVIDDEGADIKDRFSALNDRLHEVETERNDLSEKYSALSDSFNRQLAEHAELRKALVGLEQRAVDADRLSALRDLRDRYSYFFDDEEWAKQCETCLYSEGATMNSDQFTAHLAQVERYAKKASPVTPMIPVGRSGRSAPMDDVGEAELAQAIIDRCTASANRGEVMTYEVAREEIIKERAARQ